MRVDTAHAKHDTSKAIDAFYSYIPKASVLLFLEYDNHADGKVCLHFFRGRRRSRDEIRINVDDLALAVVPSFTIVAVLHCVHRI